MLLWQAAAVLRSDALPPPRHSRDCSGVFLHVEVAAGSGDIAANNKTEWPLSLLPSRRQTKENERDIVSRDTYVRILRGCRRRVAGLWVIILMPSALNPLIG